MPLNIASITVPGLCACLALFSRRCFICSFRDFTLCLSPSLSAKKPWGGGHPALPAVCGRGLRVIIGVCKGDLTCFTGNNNDNNNNSVARCAIRSLDPKTGSPPPPPTPAALSPHAASGSVGRRGAHVAATNRIARSFSSWFSQEMALYNRMLVSYCF